MEQDDTRRAALVAGLRQLADWLEATPEVPVPYSAAARVHVSRDVFEGAEATSALSGLPPREIVKGDGKDYAECTRHFGGGVHYAVQTSIPPALAGEAA